MKPPGEEEYQRFMGFRSSLLPWRVDRPEGSQKVGGREREALSHPIAFVRWRIAVRRKGPYAPDFAEFLRKHPDVG